MRSLPWRLALRVIAVLSWIVSIAWLIVDPGFEPLLAFLAGAAALLGSFAAREGGLTPEQRLRSRRAMPEEKTREEAMRINISALDDYEKAVLREFFIQERNTIRVPEEDVAVAGLMQKGIISIIGDGKFRAGVGETYLVSLSPYARTAILRSGPQAIGLPTGNLSPEQGREIQNLRPGFVWDIKHSDW